MLADAQDVLVKFRGQYGRLCTLVALAMAQGHSKGGVVEAARGNGRNTSPVYVRLRRQRQQVNAALDLCKWVQVPISDVVRVGREVKAAVEGEWMAPIPMISRDV